MTTLDPGGTTRHSLEWEAELAEHDHLQKLIEAADLDTPARMVLEISEEYGGVVGKLLNGDGVEAIVHTEESALLIEAALNALPLTLAEIRRLHGDVERLRSDYEARGNVIESLKREVTQVSLVARRTAEENDKLKAELDHERASKATVVQLDTIAIDEWRAEVERVKAESDARRKADAQYLAEVIRERDAAQGVATEHFERFMAASARADRLLPVVEAAKADLTKAQTLIEVLSADQPDGEEYDAAERKLREAWPTIFGNDPVFCEQVVTLALDSAWAVNHPRRVAAVDALGTDAADGAGTGEHWAAGHVEVLAQVAIERKRQDAKWGEQNHADGTGMAWPELVIPAFGWASGGNQAEQAANLVRKACQRAAKTGHTTWLHILLEEIAETFAETDPAALRVELIQTAAVAVAWAEAIDRRAAASPAGSSTADEGAAR